MRARDVIGKRITAVRQTRLYDPSLGWCIRLDAIDLDDGTTIIFHGMEGEGDLWAEATLARHPRRARP